MLVMMFAGIFSEWVAPYDPLAIDFALDPRRPFAGSIGADRRLRPRYLLAPDLRLAHGAW